MIIARWRRPRRTLVLGGSRSGKSRYAEQVLSRATSVDYVACGPRPTDADPEWAARVAAHVARRPPHWQTRETLEIADLMRGAAGTMLVDCLSTWLAAQMDRCGVWEGTPGADGRLTTAVEDLVTAWAEPGRRVVAVSSEVGGGVVPATTSGRRFRDELGTLNARLAAIADQVWLVTAGLPWRLK